MKNRIRIGVLGFFMGLITIFGALYVDQIRGQATSLGLYQIDLAFIGYMLVGIGLAVTLQENSPHKSIQVILRVGGGIIILVSALADHIGVVDPSGFDIYQLVGMIVGAIFVGLGFFLPLQKFFQ
ncbi:MAG: hypothetical protein ACOYZ6_12185 [Chloroflexota bacterium]